MIVVTGFTMSQKQRLEYHGYRFVHLFRNVYFVRNYSTAARQFSIFGIAVLRKGE